MGGGGGGGGGGYGGGGGTEGGLVRKCCCDSCNAAGVLSHKLFMSFGLPASSKRIQYICPKDIYMYSAIWSYIHDTY